jgi:type I restriction enzyme S subunit
MKKYSSYKPSGVEWIGDIPFEWSIIRLKWITEIENSGVWGEDYEFSNSINVPIPTTGQLSIEGKWNYEKMNLRFLSSDEWNRYKCIEGDIVVVKSSGSSSNIITGKCGYISNEDSEKFGFSNFLLRVRPTKINSKLVYYFLSSNLTKQRIERMVSSTTYPNLKVDEYSNSKLLIPPLQEQEQIVKYLDEKTTIIDKLISTKQRKVEILKEQRTTLINQVITKGLNPNVKMKDSGVEWIGEIPEKWNFVRLGVLGNFSKGKGITKDKIKENGFPCIRNGEIYTTYNLRFSEPKSFIDEITTTESVKVKKGTLFFTGDGETLEEIGKCVVYLGEEEIYVGGGINVFTPKTNKISPIYLSYVMSSTSCVYQKSIGGKGEIVVHIYSKQLRDIQFGLPNLEEQKEIVEYLDKHTKEIDDLVSMEQNKIELLKEYRQSLISEIITGKIMVI